MLTWLLVTIIAYFLFGLGSLGDKLVLAGKPQPKSYTFYVGVFGLIIVFLIPFIKFGLPSSAGFTWVILDALVRVLGIYTMYVALEKFDVSRVVATIGATQPIFIFILTCIFWGPQTMSPLDILAFALLFLGSVIISVEKSIKITGDYLKITIFSSLMFSLDYVFAKMVFLSQPFLQGIVWIGIFIFLFVLVFLFSKKSRKEIFSKKMVSNKKTQILFLGTQVCGGLANFLQGFAISLAPVAFLAIINSLRGIQYAFLFVITIFMSVFLPKVLKEGLSKKIILQKGFSIVLIAVGLIMLVV